MAIEAVECSVEFACLPIFLVAVREFDIDDLVDVALKEGCNYVHLFNFEVEVSCRR